MLARHSRSVIQERSVLKCVSFCKKRMCNIHITLKSQKNKHFKEEQLINILPRDLTEPEKLEHVHRQRRKTMQSERTKTKAKPGELIEKKMAGGWVYSSCGEVAPAALKEFKRYREDTTSCNQDHITYRIFIFKGITEALLL